MPLPVQAYNLGTGNRWILVLPFKDIDPDLRVDDLAMNLTGISFPELSIDETSFPLRGRQVPIPTGVRNDDKVITCRYMLSEDWHQYRILYEWFSQVSTLENPAYGEPYGDMLMDISLYVLTAYKKPLFSILFKGCWIKSLGPMMFSYQTGQKEIETSFKFKYQLYEFEDLIEGE